MGLIRGLLYAIQLVIVVSISISLFIVALCVAVPASVLTGMYILLLLIFNMIVEIGRYFFKTAKRLAREYKQQ